MKPSLHEVFRVTELGLTSHPLYREWAEKHCRSPIRNEGEEDIYLRQREEIECRERYTIGGVSYKELAKEFQVSITTIRRTIKEI